MKFTRLLVTAVDEEWLAHGLQACCGYGTSVIACDAEIARERDLPPEETPDNRPGAALLAFSFSTDSLAAAIQNRVGQCLMTCPTVNVFNGWTDTEATIPLGRSLRFFGDGFQKSKLLGDRRFWRIPVMEGEFLVEESAGVGRGVAGGNFMIQSRDLAAGLQAARRAVARIAEVPGVITPFPGGVVRSGSKVGSKYHKLKASTYDAFCPTLRGRVPSRLVEGAECVHEIVIDGTDFDSVERAMQVGIGAAVGEGVVAISAGNYGGKLGKHHYPLRSLMQDWLKARGETEVPAGRPLET